MIKLTLKEFLCVYVCEKTRYKTKFSVQWNWKVSVMFSFKLLFVVWGAIGWEHPSAPHLSPLALQTISLLASQSCSPTVTQRWVRPRLPAAVTFLWSVTEPHTTTQTCQHHHHYHYHYHCCCCCCLSDSQSLLTLESSYQQILWYLT